MNDFLDKIDRAFSFKNFCCLFLTIVLFFSFINVNVYAAPASESETEGPIIVSMGDSYSAGEGIEDFYDQDKHEKYGV